MSDVKFLEEIIKESTWWKTATTTPDSHYSNVSGVMLSHHLLAVHQNVEHIFSQRNNEFYVNMFSLLPGLNIHIDDVRDELLLVALLHDIGKPGEDKSIVIPHPLTGKPAHKRHGIVALMAAMEIIGPLMEGEPERRNRIYRTVELHDISYGLFREYLDTGLSPNTEKWIYIDNKIHSITGAGIFYLLLFKLADVHGHANIKDVTWFYQSVKKYFFKEKNIELLIPTEADIR